MVDFIPQAGCYAEEGRHRRVSSAGVCAVLRVVVVVGVVSVMVVVETVRGPRN